MNPAPPATKTRSEATLPSDLGPKGYGGGRRREYDGQDMNPPDTSPSAWPSAIVRIAGLWVLAGALFKLLLGNPGDLPPLVQDLPLGLGLTYKLVIGAELVVAALALLRPAWAWLPLVLLFLVFGGVLASQIAAGETNCACFGGAIDMSPWVPLVVDGVLLLLILLSRPWRRAGPGLAPALVVPVLLLCVALPWVLDREAEGGTVAEPGGLMQWRRLDIENWVGTALVETELAKWIDVADVPDTSTLWILYRYSCPDCAGHLQYLSSSERGQRDVVLLLLPEEGVTEEDSLIEDVPEGDFVSRLALPDHIDWVFKAPGEIEVEHGKIIRAAEGIR